MPPRERKHWCKHCKKSFPSGSSLGGHMKLHRNRPKKQRSGTPSTDGVGQRYGLRERCQNTWCLPDYISSDDDPWALFPKTECQLCFKSFDSHDALSIHMRRKNNTDVQRNVSICDGDDNAAVFAAPVRKKRSRRIALDTVPTAAKKADGIVEEVDAAHILVMFSGDHGMCSDFVNYDEDCEMDGNMVDDTPMMELSSSDQDGLTGDNELMEPEASVSSYEEVKFASLSEVFKATTRYECNVCGKVCASGRSLGGHKKGHRAIPKSAASQPRKQLLQHDRKLIVLSLPAASIWNYRRARTKSEPDPSWAESSLHRVNEC